jgi:hypothetical protein
MSLGSGRPSAKALGWAVVVETAVEAVSEDDIEDFRRTIAVRKRQEADKMRILSCRKVAEFNGVWCYNAGEIVRRAANDVIRFSLNNNMSLTNSNYFANRRE